jgi:hypothetical protein
MQTTVELPKAFSVRDEHEFLPVQHLLARMNSRLVVRRVATGVHLKGGCTVFWGLVYLGDAPPDRRTVEAALREAGFDFAHNVLVQACEWRTSHADDGRK